eukprot:360722-Chlamydomonas_euryale.AAC.1
MAWALGQRAEGSRGVGRVSSARAMGFHVHGWSFRTPVDDNDEPTPVVRRVHPSRICDTRLRALGLRARTSRSSCRGSRLRALRFGGEELGARHALQHQLQARPRVPPAPTLRGCRCAPRASSSIAGPTASAAIPSPQHAPWPRRPSGGSGAAAARGYRRRCRRADGPRARRCRRRRECRRRHLTHRGCRRRRRRPRQARRAPTAVTATSCPCRHRRHPCGASRSCCETARPSRRRHRHRHFPV